MVAAARRRRELMENLSAEGKALYETLTSAATIAHQQQKKELEELIIAATIAHQQQKKELEELIIAAVGHAVDAAISKSVPLAVDQALGSVVEDLQAYTDGAEQDLHKQISDLRASIGLASNSGTATVRPPAFKGAAETGPDGLRGHLTTRGSVLGASLPYVPPPARGITDPPPSSSFASLIHRERRASQYQSQPHHSRTPKCNFQIGRAHV